MHTGSTGKKAVGWDPEIQASVFMLARDIVRVHPGRDLNKTIALLNYIACAGGKADMPKNTEALASTLGEALAHMKDESTAMNGVLARYGRTTLQTELSRRLRFRRIL